MHLRTTAPPKGPAPGHLSRDTDLSLQTCSPATVAAATTTSSENSLANNAASVTPSLINYSVAVQDGDLGHNSHCTGQGLTSYFECELCPRSPSCTATE